MRTSTARALHLTLFLIGVVLYVVFVLPRWWVLTGDIPTTLATAGRIAAGIPIALAAWPVMQLLQAGLRTKPPAPEIALRLRAWSGVLHVVAGVLILLGALVEIWLRLEVGGPWLFGVYGAAGAIAILGILALYLSFVAEKPPAGPKPAKPAKVKKAKAEKVKAEKKPRGKKRTTPTAPADDVAAAVESDEMETLIADGSGETPDAASIVTESTTTDEPLEAAQSESLRNKRPSGKSRRRLGR